MKLAEQKDVFFFDPWPPLSAFCVPLATLRFQNRQAFLQIADPWSGLENKRPR